MVNWNQGIFEGLKKFGVTEGGFQNKRAYLKTVSLSLGRRRQIIFYISSFKT